MRSIRLEFDKRTHKGGSKEHFWHFLLGYLLPSIHYYFNNIRLESKPNDQNTILIYRDCGPLMNPIIKEIADLLDIPFDIQKEDEFRKKNISNQIIYMPRWDIRLYISFYFILHFYRYQSDIKFGKKDLKWFIKKNITFRQKNLDFNLKKDLLFTRNLILSNLDKLKTSDDPPYLLLDRSDLHSFYAPNGKAEIKGYGKSRRALLNVAEEYQYLSENGIKANLYQPGSQSILDQIQTFNHAKGVIGMRGAELANMLWMEPNRKVIVVGFQEPAFHLYNFASLLNLKLVERKSDSDFPNIRDYNIKKLIEK